MFSLGWLSSPFFKEIHLPALLNTKLVHIGCTGSHSRVNARLPLQQLHGQLPAVGTFRFL